MQVNPSSDPPPLNQEQVLHEYHDVFSGLGKLPVTYHIDMDPNAKAVQENPRRVPIPVKDELRAQDQWTWGYECYRQGYEAYPLDQ